MAERYVLEALPEGVSFDPLTLSAEALFTQSDVYARWQRAAGKKMLRLVVREGEASAAAHAPAPVVAFALCLPLSLGVAGLTYWYAPYGPVCAEGVDRAAIFSAFVEQFPGIVKDPKAVFLRLDFSPAQPTVAVPAETSALAGIPQFLYSGSTQPRVEWCLDLSADEAALLSAMHSKMRYSISLAERKGVKVEIISGGAALSAIFEDFYRIMALTASRDGFTLHERAYYQALFSTAGAEAEKAENVFLAVARYQGEILSVALVIGFGKVATYVFGGSSDAHRNLSAPALLQWTALRHAKKLGFARYSFGGIHSEKYPVPSWKGITFFKHKFGGHEAAHAPLVDAVFRRGWYRSYMARKWVKHYFHI